MANCPCSYFDEDPESTLQLVAEVPYCECGHAVDEHDEWGECQAEDIATEATP